MRNSSFNKIDDSKRKYHCRCGESFSSLEEFNEHTDLIIQYFI
ncbi:MAG TPA: hypothetical protein VFK40_02395 [Nitrososphaeraceae archaeon]|nr:hypothetical protein [Nitrososphaeraceae archaeon]